MAHAAGSSLAMFISHHNCQREVLCLKVRVISEDSRGNKINVSISTSEDL